MSTRLSFPLTVPPIAILVALLLVAAAPRRAGAEDLVLTGPHPSLKENALSLQVLLSAGLGDSSSGHGVGIGYGYMLDGPLWLDLQLNVRGASSGPLVAGKPTNTDAIELLGGVTWRFRTPVPLVPYLRMGGGLLYLYPRTGANAAGPVGRAAAGARYYVFDWLGFTLEGALSLGHAYLDRDYPGSHNYAVFDAGLGVEWQFQ
ncbi:MAG: hypothetical protein ABJA82_10235 [Myxococcales bacterium]